jgi:hypothetical protein
MKLILAISAVITTAFVLNVGICAVCRAQSAPEKDVVRVLSGPKGAITTTEDLTPARVTAQLQKQPPSQQGEDVVRDNTNLVRTDLMVFDKQGHFVAGLQREQFELSVNGKPQAISFFEQVRAGSSKEQALKLNSNSTAAIPSAKPTSSQ